MNPVGIDYDLAYFVDSRPHPPGEAPQADFRLTTDEYFKTVGIPLLRGRAFEPRDGRPDAQVMVINQAMAQHLFPDVDPIGQRIRLYAPKGPAYEVIGVVGDVHHHGLDATPRPEMFIAYQQVPHGGMTLVVRSAGEPLALAGAIRREVNAVDPDQAVGEFSTLEELISGTMADRRFNLALLASFAGIGLLLAVTGIYAVMAYSVLRRTREIGIRVALGARRESVFRLVIGEGLVLALAGVAIGLVGSLLTTRALGGLLFNVQPTDPLTFAGMAAILIGVTLLACYLPARRAARVDPVVALRSE
jgi:putative ABC transport system permease protein